MGSLKPGLEVHTVDLETYSLSSVSYGFDYNDYAVNPDPEIGYLPPSYVKTFARGESGWADDTLSDLYGRHKSYRMGPFTSISSQPWPSNNFLASPNQPGLASKPNPGQILYRENNFQVGVDSVIVPIYGLSVSGPELRADLHAGVFTSISRVGGSWLYGVDEPDWKQQLWEVAEGRWTISAAGEIVIANGLPARGNFAGDGGFTLVDEIVIPGSSSFWNSRPQSGFSRTYDAPPLFCKISNDIRKVFISTTTYIASGQYLPDKPLVSGDTVTGIPGMSHIETFCLAYPADVSKGWKLGSL